MGLGVGDGVEFIMGDGDGFIEGHVDGTTWGYCDLFGNSLWMLTGM